VEFEGGDVGVAGWVEGIDVYGWSRVSWLSLSRLDFRDAVGWDVV
jgi:hypothetical protein